MFGKGFSKAKQHWCIVLYPLLFDWLTILIATVTVGITMSRSFATDFAIGPQLPTVEGLLTETNSLLMNYEAFAQEMNGGWLMMAVFLIYLIIAVFIEGGYYYLIWRGINGESVDVRTFLSGARKFWLRFFLLGLLVMFLVFVAGFAGLLLMHYFATFGFVLTLIVIVLVRVVMIYLEFVLVTEDTWVIESIDRAYHLFKASKLSDVIGFALLMGATSAAFGLALNLIAEPWLLPVAAPVVIFVLTGFLFTLMFMMDDARMRLQKA
ncbi:hypothetical protein [Salisediminibacterium beveridgei]|uniref:Uncharacterized protein n=1 Tax=Salisediminibacterium beveridgei TaxID=632773 RepID=A0A1D7QT56_9BACI|nr:hypothetical protein [Salisediminibacterium beveridgei]AOM82213.1 hypothetical protein BBEV_0842 [Salisediminibacterium beveridgei]